MLFSLNSLLLNKKEKLKLWCCFNNKFMVPLKYNTIKYIYIKQNKIQENIKLFFRRSLKYINQWSY